jgi:hypothetical protein
MFGRMMASWKQMTTFAKIRRVFGITMIGVAIWALTPYFYNTRVDEAFPAVAPVSNQAAVAVDTRAEPTAAAATEPTASTAAAEDTIAEPTAAAPAAEDTIAEPTAAAVIPQPTEAPPAAPAEPVALSQGQFTRVDALHAASGDAVIYRLPDGTHVLRLEGFSSTNGPDLYIGLSGHPMPRSNGELHESGYVELERLKGSEGSQNYALPADLDLSLFKSVVIYCKAFSVVFSTAELTQAS